MKQRRINIEHRESTLRTLLYGGYAISVAFRGVEVVQDQKWNSLIEAAMARSGMKDRDKDAAAGLVELRIPQENAPLVCTRGAAGIQPPEGKKGILGWESTR